MGGEYQGVVVMWRYYYYHGKYHVVAYRHIASLALRRAPSEGLKKKIAKDV